MPPKRQGTNISDFKDRIQFKGSIVEFIQWVNDHLQCVPGLEEGYKCMTCLDGVKRGPREAIHDYFILHKTHKDDKVRMRLLEFGIMSLWTLNNYEQRNSD